MATPSGFIRFVLTGVICLYSMTEGHASLTIDKISTKIPPYLKICSKSDPKLNKCIKQSIESLRPKLSKGIPEMNIPSCDPFVIPELSFKEGRGSVNVKSQHTDISIKGGSQFEIKRVNLDVDNGRIDIDLVLPFISTSSNYVVEGKILLLPISGSGKSHGNYSDVTVTASVKVERLQRKGITYFHVRDVDVHFNIGYASVKVDNLFGGDPVVGEAMNVFLNDNWKIVFGEMQPLLEETIATIFKDIANKIFERFPVDVLLKP